MPGRLSGEHKEEKSVGTQGGPRKALRPGNDSAELAARRHKLALGKRTAVVLAEQPLRPQPMIRMRARECVSFLFSAPSGKVTRPQGLCITLGTPAHLHPRK